MSNNTKNMKIVETLIYSPHEMAFVYVRDAVSGKRTLIQMGNFWDFHPGCHGITKYGSFKGYEGLAYRVEQYLWKQGHQVKRPAPVKLTKTAYEKEME
jgi:hypothetical protein